MRPTPRALRKLATAVVVVVAMLLVHCGGVRLSTPTNHLTSARGACPTVYGSDNCESDADCAAGTACVCDFYHGGAGSPGTQNLCRPSGCRIDADCGPTGYCSPSQWTACYGGVVDGYFCHGSGDECGSDADCRGSFCFYAPELGHWTCGFGRGQCGPGG